MIVSLLVIIMLFVMHNTLQEEHNPIKKKKLEKKFLYEACGLLILLAAIRYIIPNGDADHYVEWYNRMFTMSFKEVAEERDLSYVYFLSSKAFSLTGLSYHYWFAFVELLFFSAFLRIIDKFSVDKVFCLFLAYTLGLYIFTFHGLKQSMALPIIWHGFMDLYEKKYYRSILMVILAYFCHKTSMVFLVAYLQPFIIKQKKTYYTLLISLSVVLIVFSSAVLTTMADYMGDKHYLDYLEDETRYGATTFICYLMLFLIAKYSKNRNKYNIDEKESRIVMGLALISVLCLLFAFRVASAFRLCYYFIPFLFIYISNQLENNKSLRNVLFVFLAIWMLYTGRNFPYKFFWQ